MALPHGYELLEGYPRESGSDSEFRAVMRWRGPCDARYAFLLEILGSYSIDGGGSVVIQAPKPYPLNDFIVPIGFTMEPVDGRVQIKQLGVPLPYDDLTDLASTDCDCDVEVTYGFDESQLGGGGQGPQRPTIPNGTRLQVRRNTVYEAVTVPGRNLHWFQSSPAWPNPSADTIVGEDDNEPFYVRATTIDMTWQDVIKPPIAHAEAIASTVNETPWLGWPAFGVSFLGPEYTEKVHISGAVLYDVKYTFVVKTAPSNGHELHEPASVTNGLIGMWGRKWCPIPAPGTQNHWRFVARPDNTPAFDAVPSTQFDALFAYA